MNLKGHSQSAFVSAWNPKYPNKLATGAGDGTARIWSIDEPQQAAVVLAHTPASTEITTLGWSTDGERLATGSFDGKARVWTSEGQLAKQFDSAAPIVSLKWSSDSDALLCGCLDGSIQLHREAQTSSYTGHSAAVLDVAWLSESMFASCSADKSVFVWNVDSPQPAAKLIGHTSDVNCIAWHGPSRMLASGSDDGSACVWILPPVLPQTPLSPSHTLAGHEQQVYVVQWLPDSDRPILATGSFDGSVRVWDAASGTCLRTLQAHSDPIHSLAFSPDGRHLLTGSFDCRVRLWNLKSGSLSKSYLADDGIYDVEFSAHGNRIAACVANGTVVILAQ